MLTVVRDDVGRLLAACDWLLVDDRGAPSPWGNAVWVEQLELSRGISSSVVIREVIADIAFRCPQATSAYWKRRDKHPGQLHSYSASRLIKQLKEVMV